MTSVSSATAKLFALQGPAQSSRNDIASGRDIARLLARQASMKMGIVEGQLPGSYRPVYATETREIREDIVETRAKTRTEEVYEDRAVTAMRDVYETRDVTEARDIYEARDVYETRALYQSRDVTETRDVTEIRNIYEEQAVYEQREIRETIVDGTRSLTPYNTLAQAGIDVGADFTVKVGDGPTVTFRFDQSQRLSVTTNGTTERFTFTSATGSMRAAIVSALDSVAGLTATLDAGGKLHLKTEGAQSLAIADVANGILDFSGSPLAKLGLTAGTTQSAVTGHETVQTGTRQVVVGTETVVTGQETVVVGTEQVQVGTEEVLTGIEQVHVGIEQVVVGSEQVLVGTQAFTIGTERVKTGERTVTYGSERIKVGTTTRIETGERRIVGLEEREDQGLGGRNALDRFASAILPANYLDALFAPRGREDGGDRQSLWGGLFSPYRETEQLGRRSEDDKGG